MSFSLSFAYSRSIFTILLITLGFIRSNHGFTSQVTLRKTEEYRINASLFMKKKNEFVAPKSGDGNILESFFTGGAFDNVEQDAAKVAAKIKSVKDLGWTLPAKRAGQTRPRHRAWGGEREQPVQLKPNYDESNERCVEKWLTLEDFSFKTKSNGAVAATVFVALAGGGKYAERGSCEKIISQWRSSEKGGFDESEFLKTVKSGRFQLFTGWFLFLSINFFFVTSLAFPTNPAAKALESIVGKIQEGL